MRRRAVVAAAADSDVASYRRDDLARTCRAALEDASRRHLPSSASTSGRTEEGRPVDLQLAGNWLPSALASQSMTDSLLLLLAPAVGRFAR